MGIPDDLKNYRAPLGAFQLISPELAALLFVGLMVLTYILSGFQPAVAP